MTKCAPPPPNTANEGRFRLNVDSPYGERAQSTRSAGDEAWRRGENAWACRAALGLKKFARADHHDN